MTFWISTTLIAVPVVVAASSVYYYYYYYESVDNKYKWSKKGERKLQKRLQRQKAQDVRIREKRIANAKQRDALLNEMSSSDKENYISQRQQEKADMLERLDLAMKSGVKVAIDLSFLDRKNSTERERNSVIKQLCCAYGYMKQTGAFLSLHMTSFSTSIQELCNGMNLPAWKVHLHPEPLHEIFDRDSIVYLSPDSENVLQHVDPNAVYVIGGIADRSVRKGESKSRADDLKIKTARLPIAEHVSCRKIVLNIDSVIQILADYVAEQDWQKALEKHIPKRHKKCM